MLDDLLFRLTELEHKLNNLVRVGQVAEADYDAARVRVQLGPITTGWRPWLTTRAGGDRSWWAPEVGEQVVVFSPAGELAHAWVLPAGFSDAAPAPANSPDILRAVFADGLVVEHDRAAKRTTLNGRDSEGTLILTFKNIVVKTGEGGFYHLDHHGKATRITHLGGPDFKTETWDTGSVVTAEPDHGYSPPEVDA